MALCCGKTRGNGWSRYGCSRQAQPGSKFCFQHDPKNIEAAHEKRKKKWEEESRVREIVRARERRRFDFNQTTESVLRQIAEGHNDPRALARKTLRILEP